MREPNAKSRWDFGRFFRTLSYFGAIPVLSGFEWFQSLMGDRSTTSAVQLDRSGVLVIAPDAIAQRIVHRLEENAFKARYVEREQPLQTEVLPDVAIIVCVEPTPNNIEQLSKLAAIAPPISETLLVDFTRPDVDLQTTWGALDDVVMGGVSSSNLRLISGAALFAGTVSTANSGGFASVRSRNITPPLDLSAYEGFSLRLQGDGQRYKFLARCEDRWDGVAYSASFDTVEDEWTTIRLSFQDLVPVFRARTVNNGEPINPACITSLQLMLSKFEYDGKLNPAFSPGPFQLKIAAIAAYRSANPPTVLLVGSDQSQLMAAQRSLDAARVPSGWVTPAQHSTNLSGDSATIAHLCAEAIAL